MKNKNLGLLKENDKNNNILKNEDHTFMIPYPIKKVGKKKYLSNLPSTDKSYLGKKTKKNIEPEDEIKKDIDKRKNEKIVGSKDGIPKKKQVHDNDIGSQKNIINDDSNLPKELIDFIEKRKNKKPLCYKDFEKYKKLKKLDV